LALALLLLLFRLAYGTALPLPFYAKQAAFSPYDTRFIELSREIRKVRFGVFMAFAAPLLGLGLAKRDRTNFVLLGSALLYIAYHYFFTIEVMGMHGRFYAPSMPILAFAAARGVAELARRGARVPSLALAFGYVALFALLWTTEWLSKDKGYALDRV